MNKFLLIAMLLLVSVAAHAQSGVMQVPGCAPGVAPGQSGCGGSEGSNSQAPIYTGPLWQDRYGAIASDVKTGSIGWASEARSKRDARKAAIEDCGGGACKIVMEGRNTCLAEAWGGGASGYGSGIDLRKAERAALDTCKNTGGVECKLDYSACSLPVRIR